jgi:hypothetical protein
MSFKKVEKFGVSIVFAEVGDVFIGTPISIQKDQHTSISKEPVDFVKMLSPDDEEEHSLCISAGLKGYLWDEWIKAGTLVQITYLGEEFNKASKRKYKKYEVAIDDGLS